MAFMKGSQRANESFQSATQFEKVNRPQSGRKHPLDIAQVVKVAACSYLELDPQETDYIHGYKNQASDPDGLGPVEVHLHHHHHHFYKDQIKSNEYISNAGDFELETGYSMPHFNPCLQGLWNGYGNANDGTHINPEVVWPSDGAEAFAPSGMNNVTEINLGNTQAEDHYAQRDSQTFHHQAGLYQPSLTSTHQPNLDKGFSQVSYISSLCVGNLSESSHRSVEHPGSILSSDTGGWTAEGRLNLQEEPQDGANIVKKGIICENNSRPSSRTGGAALSRRRKNIMEDAACNGVLPQLGLNLETPRNCQPLESIEQVSGDRCPSRHVSCGVRLDGHGRKKEVARSEETNCVPQPSSEFHQETQRESFMSFDGTDGRECGKLNLLDQKKSWSSEAPTEEKTCIFVDNTKTAENLRSPTDEGFLFPATFTDALDPRMSMRHGSHSDICKENLSYWNLEDNSVTSREQVKKQYMIKKESRPSRSSAILNKKKDHEGMDVGTFEVSEVNDCCLDAVSNNREVYSSYQAEEQSHHLLYNSSQSCDKYKYRRRDSMGEYPHGLRWCIDECSPNVIAEVERTVKPVQMEESILNQNHQNVLPHSIKTMDHDESHFLNPHAWSTLETKKHLHGSMKTLKDINNLEASRKKIINEAASQSPIRRVRDLIEMERSKYELSKKELEQLKQNFQDCMLEFEPTKEVKSTSKASDSLGLHANDRNRSSEFDSRTIFKQKHVREIADGRFPSSDGKAHIYSKVGKDWGQRRPYELRLQQASDHENVMNESLCKQQEKPRKSPVFITDLKEHREKQRGRFQNGKPEAKYIDAKGVEKAQVSQNNKGQARNDWSRVKEADRLSNLEYSENNSSVQDNRVLYEEICQEPMRLEPHTIKMARQQEESCNNREDASEDSERRSKHMGNGCLETNVLEKYSRVYQSPIFEHTRESPRCHQASTSGAKTRSLNKEFHLNKSSHKNMREIEDGKDVEIAKLSAELEIIKKQLFSTCQEKDSEKDHLKRQLSTALDDSKCLRISLETAKRQIKEEENDNHQLKEQLEEKSNELAAVVEKHTDELQKNKRFLEEVQQLNQITESEKATNALKFLDLKSHYEKLIETLESQVKEARDDVESLREMTNELKQEISNHEVKASILEKNLAEKVNEMQELKMHIEDLQNEKQRITLEKVNEMQELKNYIQDLQNEKENMTLENFELMSKQQEAKHEAMQHARYVADYLSINEELLAFAQRKDDEVTYLKNQVASFQNIICQKTEVNSCLENALQDLRKQMDDVGERSILLEHHYEVTKTKFANIEKELTEREESLEKITRHLAGSVENQDSLLAEAEQLRRKLQDAMYKEFQLENELMQSREVIDDLKQKVCQMENEMLKIRVEMGEIGKQNSMLKRAAEAKEQDFIALQNETADLQQKVQDLEEEVMEKEGQIAILKGSFPEEFGLGF